ncbi:MAG: hypothetical protein SGI77_12720 [Pirellulaceae bacterium]|nr:hypothetical protein [Pirellulaceae bacterium]
MMLDFRATPPVQRYYPEAIRTREFVRAFLWFTKSTLGISEEQIAFLTSVCSDDINSIDFPDTKMIGPFILGGLDGYPFVGKTGIGAFSHHIPDHGAALLFIGPHVGITNAGEVGSIVRPGHSHPTSCCGADMAGLNKLRAGTISPKDPCDFDLEDYQQETLEQLILTHKDEILGLGLVDEARQFIRMSEVLYREAKQALFSLMKGAKFARPTFVFGGILINQDGGRSSSIALRDLNRVLEGEVVDMTHEFVQRCNEKFKELEEGHLDAFQ